MSPSHVVSNFTGAALSISGGIFFLYGLVTFAASRGQSVESFGAVLLGYGALLIGIYVSPRLRKGTEDALSALRRIADRFFNF